VHISRIQLDQYPEQDPTAGISHVEHVTWETSKGVPHERYENVISDTSDRRRSTSLIVFDWQRMTSY